MQRIQGCLAFSSDKSSVSFLPQERSAQGCEIPWNILATDDALLRSFIQCSGARRIGSGRGTFSYEIDCAFDVIQQWINRNVKAV